MERGSVSRGVIRPPSQLPQSASPEVSPTEQSCLPLQGRAPGWGRCQKAEPLAGSLASCGPGARGIHSQDLLPSL